MVGIGGAVRRPEQSDDVGLTALVALAMAARPRAIGQGRGRKGKRRPLGNVHRVWTTLFSVERAFLQLTLPNI